MKDNQEFDVTFAGQNEEEESAPVFNQKVTVEPADAADVVATADPNTFTIRAKALAAGADPVAIVVTGTSTSDKEGANALPNCVASDSIFNPPANTVAFTVGAARDQVASALTAKKGK